MGRWWLLFYTQQWHCVVCAVDALVSVLNTNVYAALGEYCSKVFVLPHAACEIGSIIKLSSVFQLGSIKDKYIVQAWFHCQAW
jgi:hypothetical protein